MHYNIESPTLQKFRRKARAAGSIAELPLEDRRAYGEAVEKAVLAKQRSELFCALEPEKRCPCASGTWHSDGAKISAAVRAQQRAHLQACKSRIARMGHPAVEKLYEAAIRATREAQATLSAAA